jgi:hypothetical protein
MIRPEGMSLGTYNAAHYVFGVPDMAIKNGGGGDLILLVRPSGDYSKSATRYECQLRDVGPDDHGDVAADATVVMVPAQVDVNFSSSSDVDVLAADLVKDHEYLLKDISNNGSPYYCGTTVTDAQGAQQGPMLASNRTGARFVAPASGRYFLALTRARTDGIWKWTIPSDFTYAITDVTP